MDDLVATLVDLSNIDATSPQWGRKFAHLRAKASPLLLGTLDLYLYCFVPINHTSDRDSNRRTIRAFQHLGKLVKTGRIKQLLNLPKKDVGTLYFEPIAAAVAHLTVQEEPKAYDFPFRVPKLEPSRSRLRNVTQGSGKISPDLRELYCGPDLTSAPGPFLLSVTAWNPPKDAVDLFNSDDNKKWDWPLLVNETHQNKSLSSLSLSEDIIGPNAAVLVDTEADASFPLETHVANASFSWKWKVLRATLRAWTTSLLLGDDGAAIELVDSALSSCIRVKASKSPIEDPLSYAKRAVTDHRQRDSRRWNTGVELEHSTDPRDLSYDLESLKNRIDSHSEEFSEEEREALIARIVDGFLPQETCQKRCVLGQVSTAKKWSKSLKDAEDKLELALRASGQ